MTPGRDPGRQPERTRLAWRRTTLALTVVVLLAVRLALRDPVTAPRVVAVAAALAGWLVLLVVSWRRIAAMASPRPETARRAAPLTTLAVLGYAALGTALLLAG